MAVSRAKKMLVLIGDSDTIGKDEFIRHILRVFEEQGQVVEPGQMTGLEVGDLVYDDSQFYQSGEK